ncbi:MAG: ROK family transcriptional regulator [Anaerolineales bacterium]
MSKLSFQGSNINLVKAHNLQVVLLSLLYEPSLSRVQIAQKTNLSNTTITNLIAELIGDGLVSEVEENALEPGEIRPVGRPRTSIRLEPNARFVVGVHIGVGLFRVGVVNIGNEMLQSQMVYFDVNLPAEQVLMQIAETVETVIAASGVARSKILGVGVGASGLVDFQTGVNLLAPNLNWREVPLRDYLEQALHLPVVVDNNVRTMALGETYFGAGRGVDSLAFVYGRTGVGAGLIFKGQVFRGSTKGAGEIGHSVVLLRGGEMCRCGNRGCLETLISEEAILRQADQLARLSPQGILAQTLSDENDISPIERVFRAGRAGDETVRAMLEERAFYLGVALTSVVNLFNPELILLGGIFSRGQDFFLDPVIQTVRQMSFGGMGQRVRIEATSFGWKAGVLGASALALMNFFYQPQ